MLPLSVRLVCTVISWGVNERRLPEKNNKHLGSFRELFWVKMFGLALCRLPLFIFDGQALMSMNAGNFHEKNKHGNSMGVNEN